MKLRVRDRLLLSAFHWLAAQALRRFERRCAEVDEANWQTLADIVTRQRATEFGRRMGFQTLYRGNALRREWASAVPLSTYADYVPYIARIARGEPHILTADPVNMFAGSAGTTGSPKRIPRTRRAQRLQFRRFLIEQGVLDRQLPSARSFSRGINIMSLHSPTVVDTGLVPVRSGPNAGLERIRRQIPLLWSSPELVFGLADQPTAQYLHGLFGLRERTATYLETPFAPQVVSWLQRLAAEQEHMVRDLHDGRLSGALALSAADRGALTSQLTPDPERAAEVAHAFERGLAGIAGRLWPSLSFVRTITSGTFAVSLPRLRWLLGPQVQIYSGCHSSSEGVLGINLSLDEDPQYVLAIGSAFYEFIPVDDLSASPNTLLPGQVTVGDEYELVLTTCAGLYRYRLGDVVQITGRFGEAPRFRYRYRRGTLLNLVGEKTSEAHTATALSAAVRSWLGADTLLKDYAVSGEIGTGVGQYTFFVELQVERPESVGGLSRAAELLDEALCRANPYYQSSGRQAERLAPARLRLVTPGTFERLQALRVQRAGLVNATQIKTPRLITEPDQQAWLQQRAITHGHAVGAP